MLLTTSWMLDLGLISTLLLFLLYKYATRRFDYFKKRNVFYEKPLPFFGNFKDVVTLKTPIGEWFKKAYDNAKTPYFGIFLYDEPYFVIKDPDLIKRVMIRDFNNFSDRTVAYPEHNKVLSNFLFLMPNPEWKNFRSELSPAFTSGKLRMMFPIMQEVGERYQKYLFENQGQLEAKEVSAKYATDVISKCFFGINAHCFDDENAIFRVIGRQLFDFTLRNAFRQTAYFSLQSIVKLFKINFFEDWITEYFVDSFNKVFHAREQSNHRQNDFIDILKDMKRKDGSKGRFKMEKIEGSGMQFFVAGLETTSSTIAFTLHELCLNKSIQNRLRKEILDNIKENNGLTYDGVTEMKYLDMCIKETLRKYPLLPFMDRKTMNDYKLPETDVVIEKGMKVFIPIHGLHYDEKYFPEPDKYDPERFDGTINHNIDGLVYFPFGEGPRICIGERFGLMSTKLALIHTLTKYEVDRCSKTPDPMVFAKKSLILQSEVGLPMTFRHLVPSSA